MEIIQPHPPSPWFKTISSRTGPSPETVSRSLLFPPGHCKHKLDKKVSTNSVRSEFNYPCCWVPRVSFCWISKHGLGWYALARTSKSNILRVGKVPHLSLSTQSYRVFVVKRFNWKCFSLFSPKELISTILFFLLCWKIFTKWFQKIDRQSIIFLPNLCSWSLEVQLGISACICQ
jgi:hypothetical protein